MHPPMSSPTRGPTIVPETSTGSNPPASDWATKVRTRDTASMFGRAPVIHDLNMAFTMWGFFDAEPPRDLVERRAELFIGIGNVHHYAEGRVVADLVPDSTLRLSPQQVSQRYPANWRTLTGA